jgi:hypothetical protein
MAGTEGGVGGAYLEMLRHSLAKQQERIRHCLEQLDDRQLSWRPREDMNSIGNLVLHLCGNLRQWVIAVASGMADTRDRPAEFAARGPFSRDDLKRRLAEVVAEADAALARLDEAELLRPRRVQGFEETVLSALFGSVAHFHGHAQEIVYISRLQLGDAYRFAWTPATPEQGAPRSTSS